MNNDIRERPLEGYEQRHKGETIREAMNNDIRERPLERL